MRITAQLLLTVGSATLIPSALHAQVTTDSAPAAHHLCFRGRPYPECKSYLIFELTGTTRLGGTTRAASSQLGSRGNEDLREYLAFDVGHMVNRDATHAVGWSLQGGGTEAGTRFAVKGRRRDWHLNGVTTDLAGGLLAAQEPSINPNHGVQQGYGVTAEAALGVFSLASVMVDADLVRVEGHTAAAAHAGVRLESYTAIAGGVVVLVGLVALAQALSSGF
jgi:hypothetical protein